MILNKFLEPKMVVMTRSEFNDYYNFKYGEGKLIFNKKTTAIVTFFIANLIWIDKVYAGVDLSKVDIAGQQLLGIIQTFGYWIFAILAVYEIIKNAISTGNVKGSVDILIKYGVSFGCTYAVIAVFNFIKDMLS